MEQENSYRWVLVPLRPQWDFIYSVKDQGRPNLLSSRRSIYKLGRASCESGTKAAKGVHKLRWMIWTCFARPLHARAYADRAWPELSPESPCTKLVLFLPLARGLGGSWSQVLLELGWRIKGLLRMSLQSGEGTEGSGRLHWKAGQVAVKAENSSWTGHEGEEKPWGLSWGWGKGEGHVHGEWHKATAA